VTPLGTVGGSVIKTAKVPACPVPFTVWLLLLLIDPVLLAATLLLDSVVLAPLLLDCALTEPVWLEAPFVLVALDWLEAPPFVLIVMA